MDTGDYPSREIFKCLRADYSHQFNLQWFDIFAVFASLVPTNPHEKEDEHSAESAV
jgi:hypothetical protein